MSIYDQVLKFIHRPEAESFERIALEVFRHQFETIGAYRRYCEQFASGAYLAAASRDSVDVAAAIAFLRECETRREPVCIMGTTAAFAALFSALSGREMKLRLAQGSRMMDTGGAKGQAVPMQASEMIARAGEMLAIAPALVI